MGEKAYLLALLEMKNQCKSYIKFLASSNGKKKLASELCPKHLLTKSKIHVRIINKDPKALIKKGPVTIVRFTTQAGSNFIESY
jgi:hypothetical protein